MFGMNATEDFILKGPFSAELVHHIMPSVKEGAFTFRKFRNMVKTDFCCCYYISIPWLSKFPSMMYFNCWVNTIIT